MKHTYESMTKTLTAEQYDTLHKNHPEDFAKRVPEVDGRLVWDFLSPLGALVSCVVDKVQTDRAVLNINSTPVTLDAPTLAKLNLNLHRSWMALKGYAASRVKDNWRDCETDAQIVERVLMALAGEGVVESDATGGSQ